MKLLGLIIVFLSSVFAGFFKARTYKEIENELNAFIALIYFIKREISSYLTSQNRIYEKFNNQTLEKNGFLPFLRQACAEGIEAPLHYALTHFDTLKNDRDAYEILEEFSQAFGTLSTDEECRRCDRAISRLEEIYAKTKEETTEKARLCRSVGAMIGLGLVLLLW